MKQNIPEQEIVRMIKRQIKLDRLVFVTAKVDGSEFRFRVNSARNLIVEGRSELSVKRVATGKWINITADARVEVILNGNS